MLGRNATGWPYPVDRFAPKLTSNNITPQNAETKVPELTAALLEERSYNDAISDLRLGEQAAAAERRADFAPIQRAVEQLGVVTGLAAVAPEALADSYARAIKEAVDKGEDISGAIENVKRDLVAKIKSGEIEYNKVDGVLEKISAITGAPIITTGDKKYKIDAASGKMIDIASGTEVADVRKVYNGFRVSVPGKDAVTIPTAEFDKVFNVKSEWGALKPDTKNKINTIYAAINPAAAPPIEYDPLEKAERSYKKTFSAKARGETITSELIETMFANPFEFDTDDMKIEPVAAGEVKMTIADNAGLLTTDFAVRLSKDKKTVGVFDAKSTKVAELPVRAFSAWMDAADIASSRAYPTEQGLRDRVVITELNKKLDKSGRRANYVAEIKKIYDAAGLDFDVSYAGSEINRAAKGKPLTGEGKTFGQQTKEVSTKLFNEVVRQLDKMEASGKITARQRAQMTKKVARQLRIKMG